MKLKDRYGFKHIDLKGKFCVPVTSSTSRMIQEIVFELGGSWVGKDKFVCYENMPFLILECTKDIELFYLKKLGKDHKDYQLVSDKDMIIKLLRTLVYKQSFKIRNLSSAEFTTENQND